MLHHDISEGNLMFLKAAENEVKGVLNDWDMARVVDQLDNHLENADLRTGTLPFMALDLLKSTYHSHCFRHDLESMFYVLIWAALHYNLKMKTRDATVHPSIVEWTRTSAINWQSKAALFTYEAYPVDDVYAAVKPEFVSLVKEWIEPIRELFIESRYFHAKMRKEGKQGDESTYSGTLTFKSYMAAIQATPRTWGIPGFLDDDSY